eukprot:TRINITY_DN33277_c0_g1_i1.p1 TRINITY_DN33277_c0_g1~~TRINITY_DN33277_c0_g1_i1.p1  ORF type:complete len:735 (-),score=78.27 TRINITY_DN33277_c0_g1_i1:461-2608(-)
MARTGMGYLSDAGARSKSPLRRPGDSVRTFEEETGQVDRVGAMRLALQEMRDELGLRGHASIPVGANPTHGGLANSSPSAVCRPTCATPAMQISTAAGRASLAMSKPNDTRSASPARPPVRSNSPLRNTTGSCIGTRVSSISSVRNASQSRLRGTSPLRVPNPASAMAPSVPLHAAASPVPTAASSWRYGANQTAMAGAASMCGAGHSVGVPINAAMSSARQSDPSMASMANQVASVQQGVHNNAMNCLRQRPVRDSVATPKPQTEVGPVDLAKIAPQLQQPQSRSGLTPRQISDASGLGAWNLDETRRLRASRDSSPTRHGSLAIPPGGSNLHSGLYSKSSRGCSPTRQSTLPPTPSGSPHLDNTQRLKAKASAIQLKMLEFLKGPDDLLRFLEETGLDVSDFQQMLKTVEGTKDAMRMVSGVPPAGDPRQESTHASQGMLDKERLYNNLGLGESSNLDGKQVKFHLESAKPQSGFRPSQVVQNRDTKATPEVLAQHLKTLGVGDEVMGFIKQHRTGTKDPSVGSNGSTGVTTPARVTASSVDTSVVSSDASSKVCRKVQDEDGLLLILSRLLTVFNSVAHEHGKNSDVWSQHISDSLNAILRDINVAALLHVKGGTSHEQFSELVLKLEKRVSYVQQIHAAVNVSHSQALDLGQPGRVHKPSGAYTGVVPRTCAEQMEALHGEVAGLRQFLNQENFQTSLSLPVTPAAQTFRS